MIRRAIGRNGPTVNAIGLGCMGMAAFYGAPMEEADAVKLLPPEMARKFVCIVDESKLVPVLGRFPLPVEVIPMARSYVSRELVRLGGHPVYREGVTTDNGNSIVDVHALSIVDPTSLEREINQIAGVVTVGLFACRPADVLIVGGPGGVRTIKR